MDATAPAMPSRIADIKSEIIALGFGNRLPGITEKPDLIALLLDARKARASAPALEPASLRKIPVVLLGELHDDIQCSIENSLKLKAMGVDTPSRKHEFLLVSEGRGVNPCYEAIGLPHDRILVEHPFGQSKAEMLDKLLLTTELLTNVLEGTVKQGTGAAAGDH